MAWVAPAIAAGGDILGGALGAIGANKASKAQKKALEKQLALQTQMYYANLGINEPWRATGQGANNALARLYGLPYQDYQTATQIARGADVGGGPGVKLKAKDVVRMMQSGMSIEDISKLGRLQDKSKTVKYLAKRGYTADQIKTLQQGGQYAQEAPVNNLTGGAAGNAPAGPDMSVFTNSPGYQFRRDEGQRDIGNSFAARGGAFGGNALRALTDFNQNRASEDFYNFVNQMNIMSGRGGQAAQNATDIGQNFSNQAGNNLMNQGNARASGIAGQYNMIGAGLSGAGNALGNWWDNRPNTNIIPPQFQFAADPRTLPIRFG